MRVVHVVLDVARARLCPASGRRRPLGAASAIPLSTAAGLAWSWIASKVVMRS